MIERTFNSIANKVAHLTGLPMTFAGCCLIVLVWAASGPVFHFSDTWQLIINTGTTIVTFLMVFLIQNTQNRDSAAMQAKLDELIRVSEGRNRFIGIEHLTEAEVEKIRLACENAAKRYEKAAAKEAAREVLHKRRGPAERAARPARG